MITSNQTLTVWRAECNSSGMPHRLLVVDDDEQIVASLREYLVSFGYEVDFAYELEEAQTLLSHFIYDAVVTDLRLTPFGFSGLEIIRQVREGKNPTHVVVLTGHGWPELEAEASANGVCVFLQKPIKPAHILNTINLLVGAAA
jgi:DNA-binding response OmpR family regulator